MAVWSNDPDGPVYVPVSLVIDDIVAANPIGDTLVQEGFASYMKDISKIFLCRDKKDLTYSVSSSNEMVALSFMKGTDLILVEGGDLGNSTITVTASDGITLNPASTTFTITVNQSTVGLESMAEGNFTVYPNPSDGHVTMALPGVYQGELLITVFNMNLPDHIIFTSDQMYYSFAKQTDLYRLI